MKKILLMAVVLSLAGCATAPRQPLQGPVYSASEGRNVANVLYAQVNTVKLVQIQKPVQSTWQGTTGSAAAGGLIGGAIGSTIGNGRGKKVATAVGALAGAGAGVAVHDELARQESLTQGVELQVRLNDGSNRVLSVIQEVSNNERFYPGQTVSLVQQRGGYHASPI